MVGPRSFSWYPMGWTPPPDNGTPCHSGCVSNHSNRIERLQAWQPQPGQPASHGRDASANELGNAPHGHAQPAKLLDRALQGLVHAGARAARARTAIGQAITAAKPSQAKPRAPLKILCATRVPLASWPPAPQRGLLSKTRSHPATMERCLERSHQIRNRGFHGIGP